MISSGAEPERFELEEDPGEAASRAATRWKAVLVVVLALAIGFDLSCARSAEEVAESGHEARLVVAERRAVQPPDIMEVDRAFSGAVAERGLEAWVAAFAEDGAMIPASGPIVTGREAIRETMAPAFGTPGFVLEWEPRGGEVASSGDLAYTFGDFESRSSSEGSIRGRYLTVWKRDADGRWRVVADIGAKDDEASSPDRG